MSELVDSLQAWAMQTHEPAGKRTTTDIIALHIIMRLHQLSSFGKLRHVEYEKRVILLTLENHY
jgi:hypothetical protein